MPGKVLILLDKIKNPNCGLGRVAIDFSQALTEEHVAEPEITFILPAKGTLLVNNSQSVQCIHPFNRYIPYNADGFDVFHALHQLPSFKIRGASKNILTIHDLNFIHTKSIAKSRRYLNKVQHQVDRADALVFVSNFTRDECYRYLKITRNKIALVIYNGVELPAHTPVKPGFIDTEDFLFSIGQFLPKKNFHVLLPFLKKLPGSTKLVIAGENNSLYGDHIRKAIADKGLHHRVILPGPVTEAEKLYLYLHCTAFLFPSLAEGFGLPVLEAMRAGKPVFCSDKTSLKEIGDRHVQYWNSFDPQDMLTVYEEAMAVSDQVKIKEAIDYSLKFTWQQNARSYIELYKSLLPVT
jgi:glycosyltransferase involved in cell wall biosynthesis